MAKKKENYAIEQKNGWLGTTVKDRKEIFSFADCYREFISTAKTEREANDEGIALAEAAGFRDLSELIAEGETLRAGDRVYLSQGGKTLILAHIGELPADQGFRIIGGHTDSPRLDLKPRPLYEDSGMALLDTHYYGGIRKYQWVTTPLAIHGVVIKKDGTKVTINIGEDPNDPVFCVTDLLPHLAKDQNDRKLGVAITGEGLNVLCGSIPAKSGSNQVRTAILEKLHGDYGIDEWDLTSAELEIVPAGPARDMGFDRSLLLGYGHDDRASAYPAMRAILDQTQVPQHTAIVLLCDKEEIGSVGSTGMNSQLFENAMAELINLCSDRYCELTLRRALKRSKMLSADVNVLHDPNYPEVSSPNKNMAQISHGLVLTKYVGARGKSGSNDAHAEYIAELRNVFDDAGVVWQTGEIGKVDQGGGGTIAYMLARYEMDVIDCGVGVLSMHAPMEVVSKFDLYQAYRGFAAFLDT